MSYWSNPGTEVRGYNGGWSIGRTVPEAVNIVNNVLRIAGGAHPYPGSVVFEALSVVRSFYTTPV